jgi:predicted SnoaL-like aldol condensation-catalyzing enzyme
MSREQLDGQDQREDNKSTVLAFYDKVVNQTDFEGAARYLGPRFVQHNPDAADGAEGLRAFMEARKRKFPRSRVEVKRAFADGDYVILHGHVIREPGTRGSAHIDIFRLERGKVVEHWDVDQPIPDQSANANGVF